MWTRTAIVSLLWLALGCATAPHTEVGAAITPEDLLTGHPLGVAHEPHELIDEAEVLAVSAEMNAFLETHVTDTANEVLRLRQLAQAIIGEHTAGLAYDDTTLTAAQTFRERRGNCLSFSNMFVALARRIGLTVEYQEVDVPPDWTLKDDAFVLNRHVNVLVDLGRAGTQVVDFNIDDFRATYDRRQISDARALAHFYNNMGVERMQSGDLDCALAYFRRAVKDNDPDFSPAWTNLGTLYQRTGRPDLAEAAYLRALDADRQDLVAMSNLAALYERRGDPERAAHFRKQVVFHRNQNPFYRYQLARKAFLAGNLETAIRHLKHAIRARRQEDRFYFLLAAVHMQKGDVETARRWLIRAQEVAATDAVKRRYANKVEKLRSAAR